MSIFEVFIKDKQHRTSFPNDEGKQTTKPLKIVQLDVCVRMKDVVFMEDSRSTKNNLEIHLSGRNEDHVVVEMNEYFESPLLGGGEDFEEHEEQVRYYEIIIQELGNDQQVNDVLQQFRPYTIVMMECNQL